MQEFRRQAFTYTRYFCEENIWLLARSLIDAGMQARQMQVLLFSNPSESVALFNQRAVPAGSPVAWDYHVVLLVTLDDDPYIFDFDTRLEFPERCDAYLLNTFPPQSTLPDRYRAWVRSIPAKAYLGRFSSDRSHMIGRLPQNQFPDYPVIMAPADEAIDLGTYRDIQASPGDGSEVGRLCEKFPITC